MAIRNTTIQTGMLTKASTMVPALPTAWSPNVTDWSRKLKREKADDCDQEAVSGTYQCVHLQLGAAEAESAQVVRQAPQHFMSVTDSGTSPRPGNEQERERSAKRKRPRSFHDADSQDCTRQQGRCEGAPFQGPRPRRRGFGSLGAAAGRDGRQVSQEYPAQWRVATNGQKRHQTLLNESISYRAGASRAGKVI